MFGHVLKVYAHIGGNFEPLQNAQAGVVQTEDAKAWLVPNPMSHAAAEPMLCNDRCSVTAEDMRLDMDPFVLVLSGDKDLAERAKVD